LTYLDLKVVDPKHLQILGHSQVLKLRLLPVGDGIKFGLYVKIFDRDYE
jgi:hypothetical protein